MQRLDSAIESIKQQQGDAGLWSGVVFFITINRVPILPVPIKPVPFS
jgi:hypothetical protein